MTPEEEIAILTARRNALLAQNAALPQPPAQLTPIQAFTRKQNLSSIRLINQQIFILEHPDYVEEPPQEI